MSGVHTSAHVVVVGGGISGLAAALRLLDGGVRVTVLESSGRLGGKLLAGEVAGVPVDFGAESVLARRPEAVELARAVGLGQRLQAPTSAGASVWSRGALRPMPTGHVMGVPGDLGPLAGSGVLSPEGLARARRESPPVQEVGTDLALGRYVARRLGHEVVDRLVEPLLGGVYAGDAYQISMRAAVPRLFDAVREESSLLAAVRAAQRGAAAGRSAGGPVFQGLDGGVGQLPTATAAAVTAAGGTILTGTPVDALRRRPDGWSVVAGERRFTADAVLLAVPANVAAQLLRDPAPAAAAELAPVRYASMALITMAFRRRDVPATMDGASGFLVPPVEGRTIKAATFASAKWRWIADSEPDLFVARASIGRFGDDKALHREDADLVGMALRDLGAAVGLAERPVASQVTRWWNGLPQYVVGHLDRVARARERLAEVPGLRVCGAAYDGVGIPACVGGAQSAAEGLLATLAASTSGPERELTS